MRLQPITAHTYPPYSSPTQGCQSHGNGITHCRSINVYKKLNVGYFCMSAAARGRCSITPNANGAHGRPNGDRIDDTGSLHMDLEEPTPDEDDDDEG